MKCPNFKLIFVFAAAAFPCAAIAQNDSLVTLQPEESTLRIEAAGFGITIGNGSESVNPGMRQTCPSRVTTSIGIASFDTGFNILDNPAYSGHWADMGNVLDMQRGRSIRIGWEPAAVRVSLDRRSRVLFAAGVRFTFDNYTFSGPYTLTTGDDGVLMPERLESSVRKSKFTASYVGIPLKLAIRLAEDLYLTGYATGDMLMNAHSKYRKPKVRKNLEGFSSWRISAGGCLSFHNVGIYCDYSILPLFKSGSGVDVNTFSVGLRLGL